MEKNDQKTLAQKLQAELAQLQTWLQNNSRASGPTRWDEVQAAAIEKGSQLVALETQSN